MLDGPSKGDVYGVLTSNVDYVLFWGHRNRNALWFRPGSDHNGGMFPSDILAAASVRKSLHLSKIKLIEIDECEVCANVPLRNALLQIANRVTGYEGETFAESYPHAPGIIRTYSKPGIVPRDRKGKIISGGRLADGPWNYAGSKKERALRDEALNNKKIRDLTVAGFIVFVIALGIGVVSLNRSLTRSMYGADKVIWGDIVDFRCQIGRWPKSSEELLRRSKTGSKESIRDDLRHLGIHFSIPERDLHAKTIRIEFISQYGDIDDWNVAEDKGECQSPYPVEFE